jgi:hypothetical protein
VLNVPDHEVERMIGEFDTAGFSYFAYPGLERWGLALAGPDWVREQVSAATDLQITTLERSAWEPPNPRQDVIGCVRRS